MIFYYTGTGNTEAAAREMAAHLGASAGDVISMADCQKQGRFEFQCEPGEALGFAAPVYFYGMPASAADFLRKVVVKGSEKMRTFALVTCGGTTGTACESMARLLGERGIEVGYRFGLRMPKNYAVMYPMLTEEKQQERLRDARGQIGIFAEAMKEGRLGEHNDRKGPMPGITSMVACSLYSKAGMVTKKFRADDSCTGCGKCEKLCPVSAIEMSGGKPRWVRERCDRCLACYHHCPVNAIQVGKSTEGKGQYVYPAE